jgi:serine/threonine protein kinase
VKRLALGSTQGVEELKTELVLVAKLQHKNLVRLIGVCFEDNEKLIVYEYMPNRSLDTILFGTLRSLGFRFFLKMTHSHWQIEIVSAMCY